MESFNKDFAGFFICNDEFKGLCRADWAEGEFFLQTKLIKRKTEVKSEFEMKTQNFVRIGSTPETNAFWKIFFDHICNMNFWNH